LKVGFCFVHNGSPFLNPKIGGIVGTDSSAFREEINPQSLILSSMVYFNV
jgi:hypothetical protein